MLTFAFLICLLCRRPFLTVSSNKFGIVMVSIVRDVYIDGAGVQVVDVRVGGALGDGAR